MNIVRRELSVAFSKHAQPIWLRITKWVVLVGVAILLHGTKYFWIWVLGLPALGLVVHLVYRKRTHAWTRPWGGWNDVGAGQD